MAPRKTKKAAESKVATSEAPKKGRGKAKITEEETDAVDIEEVKEEIPNKNSGRRNKAANGDAEEIEPVVKQGRKKKAEDTTGKEKSSKKAKKDSPKEDISEPDDQIDDIQDESDQSEKIEVASTGRSRKKQTKKENGVAGKVKEDEDKPKSTSRGKKNIKPSNDSPDSVEMVEVEQSAEKPKSTKGRGKKAQAKVENDEGKEETEAQIMDEIVKEEDAVQPAVAKGKKNAKALKEKTPDAEAIESDEKKPEEEEEHHEDPPQKKTVKGRKNQGKKAQVKEVVNTEKDEDVDEEPASKKTKAAKKAEVGKGDSAEVNDEVKAKPAKNRRAAKKPTEVSSDKEEEESEDIEPISKRQRKVVPVDDKGK